MLLSRYIQRMEELIDVTKKYDTAYIEKGLSSLPQLNEFATVFYKDVAEIYDCITRIRNTERNPQGFSMNDAPILGLLVRVWKLLKEVIKYYESSNAEIISILDRPLLEASVVASYLMVSDDSVIEDYRKCSYKDRLRILRDLETGSPFFETKAGKRLLKSILEKMEFENLTPDDFEVQKKNRWRIQGQRFHDIFSIVTHKELYASTYGMMSESIHGSWNESMDWCLVKNDDGSFSANPFSFPADIRFVSPTLRFTNPAYRLWIRRVSIDENDNLKRTLDWIDRVNHALFMKFDAAYDG
jgi:hypothetical protein